MLFRLSNYTLGRENFNKNVWWCAAIRYINFEISCINNYMANSHFKRGELYSGVIIMLAVAAGKAYAKISGMVRYNH